MYGFSSLANKRLVRLCSVRLLSDNNQSTKKLLELIADMPKANSSRIAEAQRQRQNISKKSDKYAPSTVYLQVIGSGARGAPNTLYLFTDQKRYLFNCGECTQRLAHEHKVKLSRLDHIFITNKTWRNIGGLPGLSLTLQDVGVPNITLHGPEGLDELYNATKRFVVMKDMNVTMAKCTPSEDFEDNALTIKYVLLGPHDNFLFEKPAAKKAKLENIDKEFEEFIHDETDYYNKSFMRSSDSFNRKEKNAKPKSKDKETDKTDKLLSKTERALHILDKRSDCSVAYICTLKKRFGTLDLAKCVEFGVKPGPMLGQLKSGQDVLLPDGTLVLSKDVKTPDDPGPVFIVLEVPDITYLKESEFELHFDTPNNPPENIPALIVHLSPPHVFNHETYRTFMSKFGASCRHLVLNSQNSCLGSEAVHRTQHKLNLLDSEIFPLLKDASVPAVWNSRPSPATDSPARRGLEDLKNKIAVAQFQNIINMEGSKGDGQTSKEEGDKLEVVTPRTLTAFQLRPKRQVDRSAEPKLHIQEYIQETMDVDGFVGSLEQFRRLVENMRYARVDSQREYPKVVFLGTGSCIPSKTRNTSAIAVQISEHQSMLMDCGEGTFGQLVRFFGPKKVNSFLRTLKAIYVSHLHADHHIGLIGVLQARREAFEQAGAQYEPLYLLAPGQIITWLSIYDQQFERIKADFTLVPNQNLLIHSPSSTSSIPSPVEVSPAMLACLGVQDIRTCLVSHCPNAFGVCLDIDGHNKLTYSGDTIPCDALVQLGKGSTLLIHEATMEDELADEARIKMHSTTSQAIEVGKQMQARYTLLTHFSQRYARLPRLNATILHDNHSVGIAFDNMQISMSDLELLPHMYAPLQLMFAEHCVEMEIKAKHRARQKQRRTSSPSMPNSAEHNKFRWISPGCRTVTSVAIPHANYRETNASRLRQEIKGMAITGIVRKGQRSGSASPTHKRSPTASPTRLHTGDGSPKKRDSEKNLDVTCNSRTVSETSSSSRDTQDKLRTGIASSGYVVDTRSKTLNSLPSNTASTDKVTHLHKFQSEPHKEKKESPSSQPASKLSVAPTVNKGYGKPLVTPVNKKLSIRRDYNLTNEPRVRETTHTRHVTPTKSPSVPRPISPKPTSKLSHQAAHKPPFNTSPKISGEFAKAPLPQPHYKVDMMTSVLVHLIMWRVAHIASYLYSTAWPCAMAITALAIVFWTAIKDAPSANSSNVTIPSEKKSPVSAKCRPVAKPRPASANASRIEKNKENVKKNENRPITARNLSSSVNKVSEPTKPDAKAHVSVSKVSTLRSSLTRIPTKIYSENNLKQRNISTERLKQQFCRDTPIYAAGRPNSVIHSNKSFKPQLEDIQSSYLLLNKTQHELENKLKSKPESRVDEVPFVPKKFDDNERKFQLYRIKQKFKSRRFFHDSRYEKIEGLNWISWKD